MRLVRGEGRGWGRGASRPPVGLVLDKYTWEGGECDRGLTGTRNPSGGSTERILRSRAFERIGKFIFIVVLTPECHQCCVCVTVNAVIIVENAT